VGHDEGEFSSSTSLVLDGLGNTCVADESGDRVQMFRLLKKATSLNRDRGFRGHDVRAALQTLGARLDTMHLRQKATVPIDLM
jgi:hypothetical protein